MRSFPVLLGFHSSTLAAARRVDAFRSLAASLRSGVPMRTAIAQWALGAPDEVRPSLEAAGRRARLGAPLSEALAPCADLLGPDQVALETAVDLHLSSGANAAALLDASATDIAQRELELGGARAHAAGARLSARMIGGLPLVFVPLMPPGKAQLFDPVGICIVLAGLLLAFGGMRWLARLLPEPPATDLGDVVATCLARCLEAGTDLTSAIELCARRADTDDDMERVARRVRLGIPVRQALLRSNDEGLRAVGRCLERAHVSGAPPSGSLLDLAAARRAESERRFEAEMRRAPVKMVVPLTLCVLPSFALLGLAPFLRGVTLGA